MTPDRAQTIGLLALGWLAGQEDLLAQFMGATGAAPSDLRAGATDAAFLRGVLQFLTQDDRWVIGFCEAHELRYDDPMMALNSLPGAAPHWT
jgi:hypothetical protein